MGTPPNRTDAELRQNLNEMVQRVEVLEKSVGRLTELLLDRLPADVVNPWAGAVPSVRGGYRQKRD